MLPKVQVGADVTATQGTTLSLSFLIYNLVSLDTTEGGFHKVVVGSDQQWAEHRGRPKKWELLSFSAPPGKVPKARLRTCWGFSGHLTGGRAGWRAGRGWCGVKRVSLFPLCDPAIWKQTPCLPPVQPMAALSRTMAGYRPALASNGVQISGPGCVGLGHAGLVSGTHTEGQQPPHPMRGPLVQPGIFTHRFPGRPRY